MKKASFNFALIISTAIMAVVLSSCSKDRTIAPSPASSPQAGLTAARQRALPITRFFTSQLTEDEADRILRDASLVLQMNDGDDDVACNLTLSRDGDVSTFTRGNGIISSEGDFTRVCSQPGFVHIVNQINWCNGSIPNVIGCASTPGDCMIVVRFTPEPELQQEGILWAHEYGHTRNLSHRDESDAVMNPVIEADHRKVNQEEADTYLESAEAATSAEGIPQVANVRDFVHQTFIHGVPFDQARQFNTPEAIQTLISMLQDPSEESYWPNIVVTLGMTGNGEALQHLSAFVQRGEGVLSPQAYRAKTSALIAVGYVLGQTRRAEVVNYLVRSARPESWRRLKWASPFMRDIEDRNLQLAQSAIIALGLSGDQSAQNALLNLERQEADKRSTTSGILSEVIQESLKESRKVQTIGLEKYTHRERP